MTKDIKQIRTVSEALVIIKKLQSICKEQREEINDLKAIIEIGAKKSKSEASVNLITKKLFKNGRY